MITLCCGGWEYFPQLISKMKYVVTLISLEGFLLLFTTIPFNCLPSNFYHDMLRYFDIQMSFGCILNESHIMLWTYIYIILHKNSHRSCINQII